MHITLNNGVRMPAIGFGTAAIHQWQYDGDEVYAAVACALEAGYRALDTAAVYGNERSVGAAVRASGIPREELFVTTKVWNHDQGYDATLRAVEASERRLDIGVIDLLLIHWPNPAKTADTWRAFERLLDEKRVRAVGVSNFRPQDIAQLAERSSLVPACNQIELHPYLQQRALRALCAEKDIVVVSWSPLGTGSWSGVPVAEKPLGDPAIAAIAEAHGVSTAQVILRWNLDHGLVPIPKSETPAHIRANLALDFALSPEQRATIDGLDRDKRYGYHPDDGVKNNLGLQVPA